MKRIRIPALVTVLLLLLSSFLVRAAEETGVLPSGIPYEDIAGEIDAFLAEHAENRAAVATAVFTGEEDVLLRWFGCTDAAGTVPLTADSVLEWGSTSKLLVWVSAMQLVCGGQLELDADVRGYLPEGFLRNLRFDEPVTMLHLMNHTAGFQETDFILEVTREEDIVPLGEYLAEHQPLQVFAPGSVAAYSNWGAALAGYIVECVSGMPFWEYVRENVFLPLGMDRSALSPDLHENPYVREKRREFVSRDPDGALAQEETKVHILPYPAGMCVSTLEDFLAFGRALLTRDERLLPPEGFALMYSPSLYYTGTELGRICHGFLVDYDFSAPVIGHDGATAGGCSRLILDPAHGVGMVVLTNQLGGSLYRRGMAELVFGRTEHQIDVDGVYIPARKVFAGKQKILSDFFLIRHCHFTREMTGGMFLNVTEDRLEVSSTDYLVPRENYALHDALAVAWQAAAVLALSCFVLCAVIVILDAVKKRPPCAHDRINGVFALLTGLTALFVSPSLSASAALAYFIVLGVLAAALLAYLTVKLARRRTAEREKGSARRFFMSFLLLLCFAAALSGAIVWDIVRIL